MDGWMDVIFMVRRRVSMRGVLITVFWVNEDEDEEGD